MSVEKDEEHIGVCFANGDKCDFVYIDDTILLPYVVVKKKGDDYYWSFSGLLEDSLISVNDEALFPRYSYEDNQWKVSVDGATWYSVDSSGLSAYEFSPYLSEESDFVVFSSEGKALAAIPTRDLSYSNENNRVFYKDVFMDAGVRLNNRKFLYSARALGYELERVTCSVMKDSAWQNAVIGGDDLDNNGRLLYPDGSPRYRLLFVCGGHSTNHGKTLRESCRQNMRDFVNNGGGYVGTCAGAFFASNGNNTTRNNPYYLHLWPGIAVQTRLMDAYVNYSIDRNSPLQKFKTMDWNNELINVYHNGGCFPEKLVDGSIQLACYDYPSVPSLHGKVSTWAYKKNIQSGMLVLTGSHPEGVAEGPRLDFAMAMLKYAADNVGKTPIKALLRNGDTIVMDKATKDKEPLRTMIGDVQCHHFAVFIPRDASDISIDVFCNRDVEMRLGFNKQLLAFPDVASYRTTEATSSPTLFFPSLTEGLYYISVQCLTTVTATDFDLGQQYSGRTDVLNGVPYSIRISWK